MLPSALSPYLSFRGSLAEQERTPNENTAKNKSAAKESPAVSPKLARDEATISNR